MDAIQQRKLLGLIGLGVRGRGAVVGVQRVRDAAKRGKLHLAIAAPDASNNSLAKCFRCSTLAGSRLSQDRRPPTWEVPPVVRRPQSLEL